MSTRASACSSQEEIFLCSRGVKIPPSWLDQGKRTRQLSASLQPFLRLATKTAGFASSIPLFC